MKKLSLKIRLILSLLTIAAVVWFTAGLLSWLETRDGMDEFFDTYQIRFAKQLSTANLYDLRPDNQEQSDKIISRLINDGEEDDDALGFAIFNQHGNMLFHDGNNGQHFRFNAHPVGFLEQKIKGDPWRIVWVQSADKQFIIAVGQELEFRDEAALEIAAQSVLPWGIGLLLFMGCVIVLISRELKPVKEVAQKIAARKPDDLSPIISQNLPKEIAPLTEAMNKLLVRISEMLERERSFIYYAAHELRSPLAVLKVQLDVALLSENDPVTRNKALGNLEDGIERLNRLVEQLLTLSKLETNLRKSNEAEETLDWDKMIKDVLRETNDLAEAKQMRVNVINNGVPAREGKNILWSLLLRNLIDNAVKYSPKNAEITLELNGNSLKVTNSNTTVDEAHIKHLGERFFRPSGQSANGSGLGLSIVKRIAGVHGFDVKFANTNAGFTATVFKKETETSF